MRQVRGSTPARVEVPMSPPLMFFFFQAEDGIRDLTVTGVQTCALPILAGDFSRVSPRLAEDICKAAAVSPRARPRDVHGQAAETLYKTIQSTKIMAPPTNCLSPIGEKAILSGLYQQIKGDFYTAVSRPPAV